MSFVYPTADPDSRRLGLDAAASAVRRGELVVLPTDTAYGVGTDAFNPRGIASLLAAKGRGRDFPLPVLVGSPGTLDGLSYGVSTPARRLVEAFWPGALTVVVRHAPSLSTLPGFEYVQNVARCSARRRLKSMQRRTRLIRAFWQQAELAL